MTDIVIELRDITKTYGGRTVIERFELAVDAPVFGFLGQNGAGKTTLMKMMVGLTYPDVGTIAVGGASPFDPETREKIGFMPENPYFYERLTGLESLEFYARLFRRAKRKSKADYEEKLGRLGIFEARNRFVSTYSKGMKQRLGLAQALINDPEYIFLDEPLDGLDPLGRLEMKEIIKDLRRKGKKIFFNSHILFDVEELCDAIGIIHEGKLVYAGSVGAFSKKESLERRFVEVVGALTRGRRSAVP